MPRFVAPFLILAVADNLRAGVIIDLVPTPRPYSETQWGWSYIGGEFLQVGVFAQLDSDGPETIQVRSMQLDVGGSDWYFTSYPAITHYSQPPVAFWDFSSTAVCQNDPASCGSMHFIDGSLASDDILKFEYLGIQSNAMEQVTLTQSYSTKIGQMGIQLGIEPGAYVLDFTNYFWNSDPALGAQITYGFGGADDPTGVFSSIDGSITGGFVVVIDIPEPATVVLLLVGTLLIQKQISLSVTIGIIRTGFRRGRRRGASPMRGRKGGLGLPGIAPPSHA